MAIMTELAREPLNNGGRALSATDFLARRNQFFLPVSFREPRVGRSIRVAGSKSLSSVPPTLHRRIVIDVDG